MRWGTPSSTGTVAQQGRDARPCFVFLLKTAAAWKVSDLGSARCGARWTSKGNTALSWGPAAMFVLRFCGHCCICSVLGGCTALPGQDGCRRFAADTGSSPPLCLPFATCQLASSGGLPQAACGNVLRLLAGMCVCMDASGCCLQLAAKAVPPLQASCVELQTAHSFFSIHHSCCSVGWSAEVGQPHCQMSFLPGRVSKLLV